MVGTSAKEPLFGLAAPTSITGAPTRAAPTSESARFGAYNDSRVGGGFGDASARWTAAQRRVELGLKGVTAGDGIGRYGSGAALPT